MKKTKVIAVPTQEISKIVQEKLFELGYTWGHHRGQISSYDPANVFGKEAYIALYHNKYLRCNTKNFYINPHSEDYEEITMYDLFQMKKDTVEVTIKVSGKEIKEPLSIETAKSLGIVE